MAYNKHFASWRGRRRTASLADTHGRHTAGNGVIVAVGDSHQVIILVLDGGGLDGSLCTESLKVFRQSGGPENR